MTSFLLVPEGLYIVNVMPFLEGDAAALVTCNAIGLLPQPKTKD